MIYQGNFTTYFSAWLKDKIIEVDGVEKYENEELVKNLFSNMPVMPLTNETFAERFIKRNYYKEIGSETFELFEMHLAIKASEVISLYAEKIRLQEENFNRLYDRFIEVNDENNYTEESNDSNKSSEFYNPITLNFNESNSNIDSATSDSNTFSKETTETFKRNKMYSFLKTNPEVMNEVNKVSIMYEEALKYLDTLFMIIL